MKQVLFLLFMLISLFSYSQNNQMMQNIINYGVAGEYKKCIVAFESVYRQDHDYSTKEELDMLSVVATCYNILHTTNPVYKDKAISLFEYILPKIKSNLICNRIVNLDKDSEESLKDWNSYISLVLGYSQIKNISLTQILVDYSNVTYDILNDMSYDYGEYTEIIVSIFRNKFNLYIANNQVDNAVNEILPKFFSIINRTKDINDLKLLWLHSTDLRNILNEITLPPHKVNSIKCDLIIKCREMELRMMSNNSVSKVIFSENCNWKAVRNILSKDEIALIAFENGVSSTGLRAYGFFMFSRLMDVPVILETKGSTEAFSTRDLKREILRYMPDCKSIYFCPTGELESIDIAGVDERFHILYSFSSLLGRKGINAKYNGKSIAYFGDIDYGKSANIDNDIPKLSATQNEKNWMLNVYGNKVYTKSGTSVGLLDFICFDNSFEILHVSTHGITNGVDFSRLKGTKRMYSFIGDFNNVGIALSNYNKDNQNMLTGENVRLKDYTNLTLAFISTCNSGKISQSKSFASAASSLSKAFFLAGVKNIISYNQPVEDNVAASFMQSFYSNLNKNPNLSFHDVFYMTKKDFYQKYSDVDLGVVLYE